MAGTVEKLLEKLADETAQDSMKLLDSLMRRFHPSTLVNRQGNVQKVPRCIQAKVLNVISRWVKLQCQDFKQTGLRNRLAHFIEHGLAQQARRRHSLVALTSHSLSSFGAWSMPMQDGSSPPSPSSSIPFSANYRPSTTPSLQSFVSFNTSTPPDSPTFMSPPNGLTLIPGVLTLKAKDIARYLTLADFYIFRCITAYEYMHGPWREPHNTPNGPFDSNDSISLLAQRANMISHWVIHDVCTSQSTKQKRNIIRRLIEVAKLCLDWNNFHTSMVLTMGLLNGAVQRLEDVWQSLPHRDTHTFEILQKNLDVCNNMAVYRNALQKAKAPAIPFFPLVLKDVTFFMDGNATMMPEPSSGLINFGKFRSLVQFLDCTVKYTSENYYFAGDLEHLPFFPGVTLHRSTQGAPLDWVAEVVERRIQAVSRCHQDPYCEALK
ncbi:ras guanine nucleotide exchange factor domain-containing protein [Phycomyces nitens]|nr:ras guanine nucleotide exchange factor domain-containing protein [Phycomyces nitens]